MIENRNEFLSKIAKQLGRPQPTSRPERNFSFGPQHQVLANATQEELVDVLVEQCKNIHTKAITTTTADLVATLQQVVADYKATSVITSTDQRFADFGVLPLITEHWPQQEIATHQWQERCGQDNITFAERADVGIMVSEMTLAESGTAVLFSDKDKGRSISFLPQNSIILIPKSTIVPRMTQAAATISAMIERGEQVASCVNFITGPSNSADIEMILVVGVHGPIKMTYIIIEDQ